MLGGRYSEGDESSSMDDYGLGDEAMSGYEEWKEAYRLKAG